MKLMPSIDRDNLNGPYAYYDLILKNYDGHYDLFRPKFSRPHHPCGCLLPLQFFGVSLYRHRGRFLWFLQPQHLSIGGVCQPTDIYHITY